MTLTPTVERVAKAIALSGNGGTWDDWYNEDQREFHRKRAIAAIEAMREPSPEMLAAMKPWTEASGHPELVWRAGIDAALGEKP